MLLFSAGPRTTAILCAPRRSANGNSEPHCRAAEADGEAVSHDTVPPHYSHTESCLRESAKNKDAPALDAVPAAPRCTLQGHIHCRRRIANDAEHLRRLLVLLQDLVDGEDGHRNDLGLGSCLWTQWLLRVTDGVASASNGVEDRGDRTFGVANCCREIETAADGNDDDGWVSLRMGADVLVVLGDSLAGDVGRKTVTMRMMLDHWPNGEWTRWTRRVQSMSSEDG